MRMEKLFFQISHAPRCPSYLKALSAGLPPPAKRMLSVSPRIGIVVVCSPARSHPSTDLIDSVLSSLDLFDGLSDAPVGVVCDGCRELDPDHAARLSARLEANPMRFSKRGIVSQGVAASYALYKQRLATPCASTSGGAPAVPSRHAPTMAVLIHYGYTRSTPCNLGARARHAPRLRALRARGATMRGCAGSAAPPLTGAREESLPAQPYRN
jgi:hypothetical protein